MEISRNTHYSNSSLIIKILAILCVPAMVFVSLNIILAWFEIYGKTWIREIDIVLRNGLPFFLFLTGSFIRNKKLRIPLLIFFPVLFAGYVLKTLDFYGIVDLNMTWVICPALLGLVFTYSIHFFAKKGKAPLDYLKMTWFLVASYVVLSIFFHIRIPVKGFGAVRLFEINTYLMLLLMSFGLYGYFRKPGTENNS